jgi:hypothetical protein
VTKKYLEKVVLDITPFKHPPFHSVYMMDDTQSTHSAGADDGHTFSNSTDTLVASSAPETAAAISGDQHPSVHGVTESHFQRVSVTTSQVNPQDTQTRSFQISIGSNVGRVQTLGEDEPFPTHFDSFFSNPFNTLPPHSSSHATSYAPYNLVLRIIRIGREVYGVTEQPRLPDGELAHVTCYDTFYSDDQPDICWRIIGIACHEDGDSHTTYVAYCQFLHQAMYLVVPQEWSAEANWAEWIEMGMEM